MNTALARFLAFAWLSALSRIYCASIDVNISVPSSYKLTSADSYVCTTVPLPVNRSLKLIGVKPRADMQIVHHILLYGCSVPFQVPKAGQPQPVWDCGHQSICSDGSNILYGWGRNAPQLHLPNGVGFSVGEHSGISYVVAQVHFLATTRPPNDASGVTLILTDDPVPYSAGIIAFAAGFVIPPKTSRYPVENECCYEGSQPLTTFAVRVHTHKLGRSVYMTRSKWDHNGLETLAQRNPLLPQAFVPLNSSVILPGDKLKVTCDYDSSSVSTPTRAGMTHNDEMCNMYMMVYSWFPFINFCAGALNTGDNRPGTMSESSKFVLDPSTSSFWSPPDSSLPPLGEMTGVSVSADGWLWGLYRGDRLWNASTFGADNKINSNISIPAAVLAKMDPDTGTIHAAFGHNIFFMPHMTTIDYHGNIWVTDVGLHQVLKFSPEGKGPIHALGTKLTPGTGKDKFCKPTKVAFLRDGSFFVADGYCNSRLVKFSPDGTYLAEIPIKGGVVIHYVLVEECKGLVHAVSRENGLVVSFDLNTHEERSRLDLHSNGRVWALMVKPQGGVVALAWDLGRKAMLVSIVNPSQTWELPGIEKEYPHELALGPAPLALSGAGERVQAIYVVPTCSAADGCGRLKRFVQVNVDRPLPSSDQVKEFGARVLPARPVLSSSSSTDLSGPDVSVPDSMDTMTGPEDDTKITEDEGGDVVSEKEKEKIEEEEYEEEVEEEEKEYEEEIEEEYEKDYALKREEEGEKAGKDEEEFDYKSEEEEEEEYEKEEEEYMAEEEAEEKEYEAEAEAALSSSSDSNQGLDFVDETPMSIGAVQIIAGVLVLLASAVAVLVFSIHMMRRFSATPSLVGAGAKAGFKPVPKNEHQVESFSEMNELSRTLEMDEEKGGGGRRGKDVHGEESYKLEKRGGGVSSSPLPTVKPSSRALRKDLGKD